MKIWSVTFIYVPSGFSFCPFEAVVLLLFVHCLSLLLLFVWFSVRSVLCFAVFSVLSEFAIISQGKRELVALLLLYSECNVAVIALLPLPRGAVG